jgi:hypothetical protein
VKGEPQWKRANSEASIGIERSVWHSPKPQNLKVKTGIKAGYSHGPCIPNNPCMNA